MQVKSMSKIAEKFITVTPQRATQFAEGVRDSTVDWEKATLAGEKNFEAGITAAIAAKRFGRGVTRAGSDKYKRGVIDKGVSRWPVGIAMSEKAYTEGFEPYRNELEKTTLPPRFPRRDARNLNRVAAISKVLGTLKEQRG